jgi:uncharacterized protein
MKIRIASLKTGSNQWQEDVNPANLSLDPKIYKEDLAVSFEVTKQSGKIAIDFVTNAVGHFVCDRCTEEFEQKFDGSCSVIFVQSEKPLPDEMPGDDMRTYQLGQEELDISVDVRDSLLLAEPLKHLCKEDCRGLCPRCGVNLNLEACHC